MMERALSAMELDWRVLTIHVPLSDLEPAMTGAQVMGFNALRFSGEWCQRTCGVAEVTNSSNDEASTSKEDSISPTSAPLVQCLPTAKLAGSLTSAKRTNSGFFAWCNKGFGLLRWLKLQQCEVSSLQFWLHGDSHLARSVYAALTDEDCAGIRWSQTPREYLREEVTLPNCQLRESDFALEEWNGDEQLPDASIVFVGPIDTAIRGQLLQIAERHPARSIFCCSTNHAQFTDKQLQLISAAELRVASEAYDLLQWTGCEADPTVLRDAYDEYCDF